VADLTGVTEVRVNGTAVAVEPSGAFTTTLPTRFGINFVDLASVDGAGRESSRTCAFLIADAWAPDDRTTSDILSMRLRQAACGGTSRGHGLDSRADILHAALNRPGLRNTLHSPLRASNPRKPSGCDQTVRGVCVLRSEVIYRNLENNGPNTVSLTLVDGGL